MSCWNHDVMKVEHIQDPNTDKVSVSLMLVVVVIFPSFIRCLVISRIPRQAQGGNSILKWSQVNPNLTVWMQKQFLSWLSWPCNLWSYWNRKNDNWTKEEMPLLHGTTKSSLNPVEIIQNLTTNCQRFVKVSMSNEKFTLKCQLFQICFKTDLLHCL